MSKNHSPFTSSSSPLSYWNFFSYLQHPYPLTPKLNPLKDFISLCSKNAINRILLITTLVLNNTNLKARWPEIMSAIIRNTDIISTFLSITTQLRSFTTFKMTISSLFVILSTLLCHSNYPFFVILSPSEESHNVNQKPPLLSLSF